MAKQTIDVGVGANTGTGDSLRNAFIKCNDNFDELYTKTATISTQTGTTYTLLSTDTGKVIDHVNAGAITVNLPNNLVVGHTVTYVQTGAGQITFSPASGATLRHRSSHTKTAGQWAVVHLLVRSNSGGTSAEYVLSGDTAA